jgi:hypothetical protein
MRNDLPIDAISVGSVVRFGPHPTMPDALVGHYFRVESLEEQSDGAATRFILSGPYLDPDCTLPCPAEQMIAQTTPQSENSDEAFQTLGAEVNRK